MKTTSLPSYIVYHYNAIENDPVIRYCSYRHIGLVQLFSNSAQKYSSFNSSVFEKLSILLVDGHAKTIGLPFQIESLFFR